MCQYSALGNIQFAMIFSVLREKKEKNVLGLAVNCAKRKLLISDELYI